MQTPIFTTTANIKYGVYKLPCGKLHAGKYSISVHLDAGVPQSIGKIQLCDDVYGKNGELFDINKSVTINQGDTLTAFVETKAQHTYIIISVGATSKTDTSKVTISLYPDAATTVQSGASASTSTSVHDASPSGSTPTSDPSPSATIPAGCIELKHLLQCSIDTYTNIKHDPNTAYFIV